MRILAGLTTAAAFVALSGVPAIADCSWGKVAQSKARTNVASSEETRSTAVATNDLSLETIRAAEDARKVKPAAE
uniref:hypothetical protein n=1 Tax=Stappia sp. TaxID=1870903 RepID=UPI003BAD9A26